MPINHLEQLISEWYEYQGYFVRRNVKVGKRTAGGFDGELDVVAFHPEKFHLVHLEPSTDADSWEQRERRFKRKFEVGKKHIPELFKGMNVPDQIEQIAVFVFGSKCTHAEIGGGKVMMARDLIGQIMKDLAAKRIAAAFVPEQFPILRGLHLASEFRETLVTVWKKADANSV
jgi:hypothetical protein